MATNFLEFTGTSGFLVTPVTVMTTELNTLGSGSAATSSVVGPFSQSTFSSGMWLSAYFTSGGAFTPASGGALSCWFLRSTDGGTTFETLVSTPSTSIMALPRAADFIIPLYEGGAALASNNIKWAQGEFRYPWISTKVVLQNFSGVALPGSLNILKIGAVADQY